MDILKTAQVVLAVAVMAVILLQNRGAGLGGVFGGSGNVYATKRGLEKKLYYATIVLSVLFFAVSLAIVVL